VTASFQGQLEIVEAVVRQALSQKVDSNGKIDTYGYSSSKTYLEWLCSSAIRKSVEKAIAAWVEKDQQRIQAAVEKCLKAETRTISKTLIDALVVSASNKYKLKVSIDGQATE
jgi:hypothetical protein